MHPKKSHFFDTELVRKTWEILNLTSANAVLMKLTTVMHLHENVKPKSS